MKILLSVSLRMEPILQHFAENEKVKIPDGMKIYKKLKNTGRQSRFPFSDLQKGIGFRNLALPLGELSA